MEFSHNKKASFREFNDDGHANVIPADASTSQLMTQSRRTCSQPKHQFATFWSAFNKTFPHFAVWNFLLIIFHPNDLCFNFSVEKFWLVSLSFPLSFASNDYILFKPPPMVERWQKFWRVATRVQFPAFLEEFDRLSWPVNKFAFRSRVDSGG